MAWMRLPSKEAPWINILSKSKPIKEVFRLGLRKAQREVSLNGYMALRAKLSVRLAARAKLVEADHKCRDRCVEREVLDILANLLDGLV